MKICFLTSNVNPQAGLGRVIHSLADELHKRGHEISIVTATGDTDVYETQQLSFKINFLNPVDFCKRIAKLRRFVKDVDILVAIDPRPVGIFTKIACLGQSKKIIVQTLATYALFDRKSTIKNLLTNWVYETVDKVFVINGFVKRKIEESRDGFSFGDNMSYVSVGVNTKLFNKSETPSYKYSNNYILSVGAVKYRKGQLKSIKAFINLAPEFPGLDYLIVGDLDHQSDYVKEVMSEIDQVDDTIKDRIKFIQNISDEELIDLYSGARFFVLTPASTDTNIEGFGMVYVEAALCGATALGTYDTGAEAAIEHDKSGLLVDNTVEAIQAGMDELLSNQEKTQQLANYAFDRALMFDWEYIVDQYEAEIASIRNRK